MTIVFNKRNTRVRITGKIVNLNMVRYYENLGYIVTTVIK